MSPHDLADEPVGRVHEGLLAAEVPSVESALPMPLSIGRRLGHYEITAPLGAGGMGEVYRATDSKLGRDIALKVFVGC
jgi:serine/threonine protein kinase